MDGLDDASTEGVWGHVVSLVPRSEVFEVEALVGSSLIADNAALWRELKAFSSILTELHTLEFDEPLGMTIPAARETRLTAENLGQLVPPLQLPPPNEQQQEGPGPPTKRSTGSTGDSMEAIYAIQDKLGVEKIHDVLEDIRRALRSEKAELEAEIALLMNAMDSETDNVAAKQTRKAPAQSAATKSSVCESCSRFHDFAAQQPGRIAHRKMTAVATSCGLCFSCLEKEHQARKLQAAGSGGEGGGGGGGGKQSRLRSRLQNAVDEKYFV